MPETGYSPFYFPADGGSTVFRFTDETFTRVLSALINGAALTYPDTWLQVVWDLLVNVEYPVAICEQIIDCITNDSDTRDALYDWLSTDPRAKSLIQTIIDTGSSGGTGVGITADNLDALFGACTFLIDTMHDAIVDFDELTEVGTNLRERANIILQAIPGFGDAIAAIPEYVDSLFENIIELFDAQYTTTPITGSRDRLRCGLFCLAKLNGRTLTWEIVQTYFWDLVSFESTIPNLALDFVGFLVTGSWSGQDIVNISFANMATAMRVGSKFGTQTFPNIQAIMALGLNNPDSDWVTLCVECATTYVYQWDFAASDGDWFLNGTNQGVYTSSGWEFEYFVAGPTSYVGAQIKATVPATASITSIQVDLTEVILGQAGSGQLTFANVATTTAPMTQPTLAGEKTYTFDVTQDDSEIIVVARASSLTGAGATGSGIVKRVRVYGENATLPAFTGGAFL